MNPREKEALYLHAQGLSTQQVADEMYITIHTVDKHLASCRQKLGAKNTAEAVYKAVKVGLICLLCVMPLSDPRPMTRTVGSARTRREEQL